MARISAKNIMSKYRKLPVEIEAILWEGEKSFDALYEFADADNNHGIVGMKDGRSDIAEIRTLEGKMSAQIGDYIIKGIKGEIYPCKPDIFEATYDKILAETDGIGTIKSVEEVDAEIKSLNSAIELTFGQKAVGASFNPSFMPEVDKVKMLFAETIDVMEDNHKKNCEEKLPSWERNVFRTEAYNAAVRASSAIVKYLTWRD